jgi:hypothetical protein
MKHHFHYSVFRLSGYQAQLAHEAKNDQAPLAVTKIKSRQGAHPHVRRTWPAPLSRRAILPYPIAVYYTPVLWNLVRNPCRANPIS